MAKENKSFYYISKTDQDGQGIVSEIYDTSVLPESFLGKLVYEAHCYLMIDIKAENPDGNSWSRVGPSEILDSNPNGQPSRIKWNFVERTQEEGL